VVSPGIQKLFNNGERILQQYRHIVRRHVLLILKESEAKTSGSLDRQWLEGDIMKFITKGIVIVCLMLLFQNVIAAPFPFQTETESMDAVITESETLLEDDSSEQSENNNKSEISLDVTVKITGKTSTVPYDGKRHMVNGYDVEIDNPLYHKEFFEFAGTSVARRTDIGITHMGLSEEQFININGKFPNVRFIVTDGYQEITPSGPPAPEAITPVQVVITNVQEEGDRTAPADLSSLPLRLQAAIKNDEEEFLSETITLDTGFFNQKSKVYITLMFHTTLPDLTSGKYNVEIYGIPESVDGTNKVYGLEDIVTNKYYLSDESWIDEKGIIQVNLTWTAEKYEDYEHVDSMPEDEIGAYYIGDDGEKVWGKYMSHTKQTNYFKDNQVLEEYIAPPSFIFEKLLDTSFIVENFKESKCIDECKDFDLAYYKRFSEIPQFMAFLAKKVKDNT